MSVQLNILLSERLQMQILYCSSPWKEPAKMVKIFDDIRNFKLQQRQLTDRCLEFT